MFTDDPGRPLATASRAAALGFDGVFAPDHLFPPSEGGRGKPSLEVFSTLAAVRSTLERSEQPLSADEVGQRIGVARVTARRYLEYLEVIGAAAVERECNGPGRPRNRYRRVPQPRRL